MKEVVVTQPFRRAFREQADHFAGVRALYPDAGARLERLAADLFDHIIPLLGKSPDIGRAYRLERLQGTSGESRVSEAALLAQLLPGITQTQAVLREYVDKHFNILYAVTPDKVFLLDLKHHKQRGY